MFRALSPARRFKIEASLLLSLAILLLWRAHGTRDFMPLLFFGPAAFVVVGLVRIVNNWGRPRCKLWMLAVGGVLFIALYFAAYRVMLKPRMVPISLVDGHRMSRVINGVSFYPRFERAYCWGSLQHPARPEWLWCAVFWPAAKVDRLVGLTPSLDD